MGWPQWKRGPSKRIFGIIHDGGGLKRSHKDSELIRAACCLGSACYSARYGLAVAKCHGMDLLAITIALPTEREKISLIPPWAIDQGRAKADQTAATLLPNAGIEDSIRRCLQELRSQSLRLGVAVRNRLGLETFRVLCGWLQRVKLAVEVSQPIVIGRGLGLWNT